MTYGLEIKDPSGNVILAIDTATIKDRVIYANASVTNPATVSVPGATADSVVVVTSNDDAGDFFGKPPPNVTLSGTTLTIAGAYDFDASIRILDYQ